MRNQVITMDSIPQEVIDCCENNEWDTGQNRRINHEYRIDGSECSIAKTPACSITKVDSGWCYSCFRCGMSGFVADRTATPETVERMLDKLGNHRAVKSVAKIELPSDFIAMRENPSEEGVPYVAYNWLWKYSIDELLLTRFNIGWSNTYSRCIIPVYEYGEGVHGISEKLVGWVGRDCRTLTKKERSETKAAKYITRKQEGYKRIFFHAPAKSNLYVIVEDMVSAMKIWSAVHCNVIALLNTYIPPTLLIKLRKHKIVLWLDGDQHDNMMQVVMKGSAFGNDISMIHTTRDPKDYNDFAIQKEIKNAK